MARPERPKGGWIIVALLFLFMLINFIDKAIIGLAGVPIMKELGLIPKQLGLVNSSCRRSSRVLSSIISRHVER